MSKVKVLRVATITDGTDSSVNAVAYKSVGFLPILKDENGVALACNMQPRVRNLWAERPLADGSVIKEDPLFSQVKAGTLVAGEIITLPTTPYMLGEGAKAKTVHQWTGVIFTGENAVTIANRSLRANNATVIEIDADGVVINEEEVETPNLNTSGVKKAETKVGP